MADPSIGVLEVAVYGDAASADLTVIAADSPTFSVAFSPNAIAATETTSLTYTIVNPGGATVSPLNFTNDIGGSLGGATITSINQSACTATVAGTGTGFLTVSGISIDAGESCVLVVSVQSIITPDGTYVTTTSDLTSHGLALADAASASLDITFALPSIAKAFDATTMQEGQTATMTLTLGNSGMPIAATGVNLTDTFPTGLTLATPTNASTTCTGGTLTAVAGGGSVSYAAGAIPASGTCTIVADVASVVAANYVNTTGDMTSIFGNSGTANASLAVTDTPEPTFTKAFGVATMPEGDTTSLTLTLSNVDSFLDAESVGFTDTFPSGLLVVTPTDAATSCTGGTLTAVAGSGAVTYTGGEISAGGSCTVTVSVTSVLDDTYVNTTGDLTTSLGNSGTASDTLIVTPAPVVDFDKAFGVSAMAQGDTTLLTLTLDNSGALIPATSVDFTDPFPSGITIVTPSDAATTCTGGTLTGVAGSGSIAYTGGTVAAEGSCTVTVTTTSVLVNNYVNLTGDLTSSLGNSGTATDSINITAAPIPTIAKAFTVAAMPQGDVTTLSLTLANTDALIDAEEVDVVDTFPTGMFIADPANASTTCTDGTLSAAVGAGAVSYSDGTVPTGATCTITVDVTSVATGDLVNLTDAMMSTLGDSGTATATLEITAAPIPTFAKSFSVASMTQGEVATLSFNMANTGALIDAEDVTMNDPFPAGLIVATPPNASTTCTDGTLTADADATSVAYTGGTIDAGESCTIVVDVTSVAIGDLVNLTDSLTTSLGDSGTATATIGMIAAPIPTFTKSFSPTSIDIDGVSTMSFDISSTAFIDATAVTFRDNFPSGMVVADTPNVTNSCGGTVVATAGTGSMGFGSGALDSMDDCTITVDVTGVSSGDLLNVTDDMTSSLGNSGTGSATLSVAAATSGTVTIVQISDQEDTFNFASSETLLNFSILTTSGAGSYGPVTLEAGTYNLAQSRPAGYANTGLECDDANSTGVLASGALTISLEAGENLTCTYVSVDSTVLSETVNAFLERRITLMLGSEPSSSRRLARLNQIYGASRSVSFAQGDLKSLLPFTLKTAGLREGNVSFSTSLSQAREALARQDLSLDGSATRTGKVGNDRADFWVEFQHKKYSDADGIEGKFTIGYAGVDYLMNPNVLIGGLFQYDETSENSDILSTSVSGRGWMAGPYITARLSPTLFFDGRIAYGESKNTVTTGLIGPVDFSTNRFLVDASLIGDFKAKNWRIQPNASLAYMQEIWSIDPSTGAKGETVSQGEFKFGPQFSTSIANDNGVIFSPKFGFDGVYTFGQDASTATATSVKGWRARANAGFGLLFPSGASVDLNATYDGIGEDDFEAYGAQISLSIPLRQQ
jgi:uncharacterized repeat protein (TIGR01451 family)